MGLTIVHKDFDTPAAWHFGIDGRNVLSRYKPCQADGASENIIWRFVFVWWRTLIVSPHFQNYISLWGWIHMWTIVNIKYSWEKICSVLQYMYNPASSRVVIGAILAMKQQRKEAHIEIKRHHQIYTYVWGSSQLSTSHDATYIRHWNCAAHLSPLYNFIIDMIIVLMC